MVLCGLIIPWLRKMSFDIYKANALYVLSEVAYNAMHMMEAFILFLVYQLCLGYHKIFVL